MAKAQRLESAIATGLEGASRRAAGPPTREPLEIVHAVVDAMEKEAQPAGRGRRVFPFNHVRVTVVAPDARARARLQAAFEGPPSLQDRIVKHLEAAGCSVPPLSVRIAFADTPAPGWSGLDFDLACARLAVPAAAVPAARLELTVTQGAAGHQSYTFTSWPVAIGRGQEVRDTNQRLIRTNDVVFTEGSGDVNETVSRRHARIERDEASGSFRLYDEGSAQGTTLVRRGRGIPVPRGTRGVRLQSGDEIALGRARLRVSIHGPAAG